MKVSFYTIRNCIILPVLLFSTLLTIGCGKSEIKRNRNSDSGGKTEEFCTNFFTDSNLPYTKLSRSDIQNTPDEYLFYIDGGIVCRTHNNYNVVITQRSNLNEAEERKHQNYSGELYQIFEDDDIDLLKIAASGNYAILTLPSTIPDWDNDPFINSFMNYAENYNE